MSRNKRRPNNSPIGWGKILLIGVVAVMAGLGFFAPGFSQEPEAKKSDLEILSDLKQVKLRLIESPNAFVNEPTRIRVEVINPNGVDIDKVSLFARLPNGIEHSTRGQELLTQLISLGPNERHEVDLIITPRQQGKQTIELQLIAGEKLTTNMQVLIAAEEHKGVGKFILPDARVEKVSKEVEDLVRSASTHWVATFDGSTPVRELLPPVPQSLLTQPRHLLPSNLEQVTEIAFQEPVRPDREKALSHTRAIASKILHLHNKRPDSYMEELIAHRQDLQGLPFVMGAACRSHPERMVHFTNVLQLIRGSMGGEFNQPLTAGILARRESNEGISDSFWQTFNQNLIPKITEVDRKSRPKSKELFRDAHVAALMQVCGPEQGAMRRGLTRHISGIACADSSRALAKLALYSPEDDVRREALDSLKVRKDRDYTDILIEGLRYPWPDVAKRAADAIVQLERKDLIPNLVALLDETDPRMPREVVEKGKKKQMVREMVRVNHHRNCFLCHPPMQDAGTGEVLTGAVPIPGEPLPSFSDGYRNSTPELAIRVDTTYLRQDFSVFLKVDNANPWPEMQRFDFIVRNREVDGEELAAYRKLNETTEEGILNPYHRSAVQALRDLTGRDAAPTADAWRRILKLPARGS